MYFIIIEKNIETNEKLKTLNEKIIQEKQEEIKEEKKEDTIKTEPEIKKEETVKVNVKKEDLNLNFDDDDD